MLEAFGVHQHVECVYVTLLNQPDLGISDIAEQLDLSEKQVHDALDELAQLSLVRPSWEDPGIIQPVNPEVGLGYLLAREQARVLRRQHEIEQTRASIEALIADLPPQRQPAFAEVNVSQVLGLDAIRLKLEQLAYDTREQILSMMPDGPQTPENMEASQPLDEMLLNSGVEILTLYQDSIRNDPLTRQYAKWLTDLGGLVRTTAVLPMRLLVFDRETAVLPADPERSEIGVVVITGAGPVAAMCLFFDSIWETAVPYGETRPPQHDLSFTDQEHAVVRLLAEGDTDAAISRKLGVSPRTAGRLAADIMAKLDAKSRFQAGVRIGERGLHMDPPRRQ